MEQQVSVGCVLFVLIIMKIGKQEYWSHDQNLSYSVLVFFKGANSLRLCNIGGSKIETLIFKIRDIIIEESHKLQ